MYGILNVVFGVAWEEGNNVLLDEACEDDLPGFECPYNGGDPVFAFFGVRLPGFDVCRLTYMDEQKWDQTVDLVKQYARLLAEIEDDDLRATVIAMGPPRMVIVPSSS